MCSSERTAEFTFGTWSSRSWRNKAFKYGFRVQGQAVCLEKAPFSQQQPGKVHDEMWAALLKNQGPRIEEIIPGCAVQVACPSCHDNSPVSPGPGRVIRNMLGWSQMVGMSSSLFQ